MGFPEDLVDLKANIARLDQFMNGAAGEVVDLKTAQIATLLGLIGTSVGPTPPALTWPGRHWIDNTDPQAPVFNVRNDGDTAWIALAVVPALANALTTADGDARYAQLAAALNVLTGRQEINAATPILSLLESAAALDAKRWDMTVSGAVLSLRTLNDDGTFQALAYELIRGALGVTLHRFRVDNTVAAEIEAGGPTASAASTILTREKGDVRYASSDPDFESAEIPVVKGSATAVAHGLGVVPRDTKVIIRNKVADGGWSPGDEVSMAAWITESGSGGTALDRGFTVGADATNAIVLVGGFFNEMPNKTTGARFLLTTANWKFVARAWK